MDRRTADDGHERSPRAQLPRRHRERGRNRENVATLPSKSFEKRGKANIVANRQPELADGRLDGDDVLARSVSNRLAPAFAARQVDGEAVAVADAEHRAAVVGLGAADGGIALNGIPSSSHSGNSSRSSKASLLTQPLRVAGSMLRRGTFTYRASGTADVRTPLGTHQVPFRKTGTVTLLGTR